MTTAAPANAPAYRTIQDLLDAYPGAVYIPPGTFPSTVPASILNHPAVAVGGVTKAPAATPAATPAAALAKPAAVAPVAPKPAPKVRTGNPFLDD